MSHSYEEIRSATFKVLSDKAKIEQYASLKIEVGKVLGTFKPSPLEAESALTKEDAEIFREVFWDIFRQGIIILGINESPDTNTFPFFKVTSHGAKAVKEGDIYFIVDTTVFEKRIKDEIPKIDDVSLLYLRESFQAFRSGCLLSSAVMLGVAAEHLFQLLLDQLKSNPKQSSRFDSVFKERTILKKIEKFKNIITVDKASFDQDIRENFDQYFSAIQSMIRIYRNESGHPTGKIIDRYQAFANLILFIPFGKMVHRLMSFYVQNF